MEAVEELVDVISMGQFLSKESKNLGKLPPANLLEKPADLWNFFEVGRTTAVVLLIARRGNVVEAKHRFFSMHKK